jgi:hypothetical protein
MMLTGLQRGEHAEGARTVHTSVQKRIAARLLISCIGLMFMIFNKVFVLWRRRDVASEEQPSMLRGHPWLEMPPGSGDRMTRLAADGRIEA